MEGLGEFSAGCRAAADAEQAGYPKPDEPGEDVVDGGVGVGGE